MNIEELLRDALEETGATLAVSADEAVRMVAIEGARLTAASMEPGFNMVLRASRDNVALQLGISASLEASATEARIVGVLQGVLLKLAMA